MDWSTVTTSQWSYVGVIWLGMMLGRGLSIETRMLSGLLLIALLVPTNFVVVGLAVIFCAISVKLVFQFQSWV